MKVFLTPHESGLYVMCGPEDPAEADDVSYDQSLQITKADDPWCDWKPIDAWGLAPSSLIRGADGAVWVTAGENAGFLRIDVRAGL